MNKFLDTASKIDNEIQERIPKNLQYSLFHCQAYSKKNLT